MITLTPAKIFKKENRAWLLVISLVVAACILSPIASANIFNDSIEWVVEFISGGLFDIAGLLLAWSEILFIAVIEHTILNFGDYFQSNQSTGNNIGVQDIWELVRDIVNLVIVVLFIVTAFLSIIGSFLNFKRKIIIYLVMAALLVNFSAFITLALIDISNALFVSIFNLLGLGGDNAGLVNLELTAISTHIKTEGTFDYFHSLAAPLILCVLSLFVFLANIFISLSLIHRFIVALCLTIMSPLAVLGFAASLGEKYTVFINLFKKWKAYLFAVLIQPIILIFGIVIISTIYSSVRHISEGLEADLLDTSANIGLLTGIVFGGMVVVVGLFQLIKIMNNLEGYLSGEGKKGSWWGPASAWAGLKLGGRGLRWTRRRYDRRIEGIEEGDKLIRKGQKRLKNNPKDEYGKLLIEKGEKRRRRFWLDEKPKTGKITRRQRFNKKVEKAETRAEEFDKAEKEEIDKVKKGEEKTYKEKQQETQEKILQELEKANKNKGK